MDVFDLNGVVRITGEQLSLQRRQLQRPAHPRGLRSCLPSVSLLEANGVYSTGRTSEAARNRLMEPPLKSRFPGPTCHLLQFARSDGSLFAPSRRAPLIVNLRSRRNGDNLRAVRQIPLRAQRRSGTGYAMFSRFPSPGPVWTDASPAPERSARLGASVTRPCLCRPGPSPARAALSCRVRVWAFPAIRG